MENKIENRTKNNILLALAIIAASLLIIWVIARFDKLDDTDSSGSRNKLIKQTITKTHGYNIYNLLQLEKNYT